MHVKIIVNMKLLMEAIKESNNINIWILKLILVLMLVFMLLKAQYS
jgi:hypothetical protein